MSPAKLVTQEQTLDSQSCIAHMVIWSYVLYFLLQKAVSLCCGNFTSTHLSHIKT